MARSPRRTPPPLVSPRKRVVPKRRPIRARSPAPASPRAALEAIQQRKLRRLLATIIELNPFYRAKLAGLSRRAASRFTLRDLARLPFTTKDELVADQERSPPFGTNLTFPLDRYVRMHQTSGTTGRPLRWLDTPESWEWWLRSWQAVYRRAGVGAGDRVYVAFSFGPFIGFWTAFEAAQRLGAMALTGAAATSHGRLEQMRALGATVLVSTPTYALRLAEVAALAERDAGHGGRASRGAGAARRVAPRDLDVRVAIHAGEPGASVTNVRRRIEEAWGAPVVDHAGATEVGAWGVRGVDDEDMALLETEFVAEVVEIDGERTVDPDADGCLHGELVLTNLGRLGSPVVRYRTGDVVRLYRPQVNAGAAFETGDGCARLRGGVLSRADGMIVVRGVNVYPSAIENLVREIDGIDEFHAVVRRASELVRLEIEIEAPGAGERAAVRLRRLLHERLALTTEVRVVAAGTLPRYELKAQRFTIVDCADSGDRADAGDRADSGRWADSGDGADSARSDAPDRIAGEEAASRPERS